MCGFLSFSSIRRFMWWYSLVFRELLFLSIVFILDLFVFRSFLEEGYPPCWGGDSYGHLFKIWKLMSGYHSWIQDWYGGYPFLRFYPPLAYYFAAFIGVLTHSAIMGYKLAAFIAVIIGAFSARVMLRELGFSDIPVFVASIAYAFAPYHLRILSPEGNFPRFIAINLAPLFILGFIYILRRGLKGALLAGVFASLILLIHHTLAFTLIFTLLLLLPFLWKTRREMKTIIHNIILAVIIVFLISSFWLIPFILEHSNAYFLEENLLEYLFKFQSARLNEILYPTGSWSFYQGVLMYLGVLGGLIAIKRWRILSISVLTGIFVSILLSLGYYGPTPWINKLPVLDLIPPYRWLGLVELFSSIGFAMLLEIFLSLKTRPGRVNSILPAILIIVLLLFSLSDLRYRIDYLKPEEYPGDYIAVLNYIRNDDSGGWRYFQWGLGITQGSRVAYTPALTGKPSLDGWYRQGDPSYPQHSYLNHAVLKDPGFAGEALRAYSVKYIILDTNHKHSSVAERNLRSIGFREAYSAGNFKLYMWSNYSFVMPKMGVLVIGNWPIDLGVDYDRGSFIDDYVGSLSNYSLIILNNYKYRDPIVWRRLEDYVASGGVLVINTFRSPDAEANLFGVRSVIVKVYGRPDLSSETYNVSLFSNFTYEGRPWTATAYIGDLDSLIKMGNLTVLGVKNIGRGKVYFVGLNLPYHAVYTNNSYEARVLSSIISRYIVPAKIMYRIVEFSDEKIVVDYTADKYTSAIISENYYPNWKAYIDGARANIMRDEKFGLIKLQLPAGKHRLVLVYEDPYVPLRYLSVASIIAVILFLILGRIMHRR